MPFIHSLVAALVMDSERILLLAVETVDSFAGVLLQQQPMRKAPGPSARKLPIKEIIVVVVVLVVIYYVYSLLQPGTTTITTAKTLSLSTNQTVFFKIYNGSTVALRLAHATSGTATFYMTQLPFLYNPVATVTLSGIGSVNLSTSGTQSADMNLHLVSSNTSGATFIISPLLSGLGIRTSSSVYFIRPVIFGTQTNSTVTSTTTISSATTQNSVASTSTTTQTTTTAKTAPSQSQVAINLMNNTSIGPLMLEFRALYQRDTACTEGVYNATYNTYYNSNPPPPISFANVSQFTPTNITITATSTSKADVFAVTYALVAPDSAFAGTVVGATVNTTSSVVTNVTYVGLYKSSGFDFTILNSTYAFQSKINDDCGAYITPP